MSDKKKDCCISVATRKKSLYKMIFTFIIWIIVAIPLVVYNIFSENGVFLVALAYIIAIVWSIIAHSNIIVASQSLDVAHDCIHTLEQINRIVKEQREELHDIQELIKKIKKTKVEKEKLKTKI